MNWESLGRKVADFAPLLGASLGGVGAPLGAIIAAKFGTENTPEAIEAAINKDPNAALKLASIEADNFRVKGETVQAMLLAESKSKHTTRPKIAYQAWQVTGVVILAIAFSWVYAVLSENSEMVAVIQSGWPFLLALIGPPVGWLNSYFGILRKEDKDRLDAYNGVSKGGVLSGLIGAFKK